MTIAVTGASGGLGGRVARELSARGLPQRLIVRDPARAPQLPGAEVATASYEDPEAMARALDGMSLTLGCGIRCTPMSRPISWGRTE